MNLQPNNMGAPRRSILSGAAAMLMTAGVAVAEPAHPDAELIRLCEEFIAATITYDRDGGFIDCDVDPLWHAIRAIEERLEGMEAATLDGVVAKARVARYLARQLDGSENFGEAFTGDWPEQVVRDLLRIREGVA